MALFVNFPNQVEDARSIVLSIGYLPEEVGPGGRIITLSQNPVSFLVTNGTTGHAIGDETIMLSVDADVTLEAGEVLTFNDGNEITITSDTALTSTPAAVETLPAVAAITDAATASTQALHILHGLTSASPNPELSPTDISTYQAGLGTINGVFQYAPMIEVEMNALYNSLGQAMMEAQVMDSLRVGVNVYAKLVYPLRGRSIEGPCLITQGQPQSNVHDRVIITASLAFQGEPVYNAPLDTRTALAAAQALAITQGAALAA